MDARGGMGVQVGEHNTQIIYTYNKLTWTDGVAPPPLVSVSGAVDSPYRGLNAFEEQDAAFFFGREAAAAEVLERMSQHLQGTGLLVISGVSGAGKSSLLRAGVLPRIRGVGLATVPASTSWPCLLFTPAHTPLDELAVQVASLAGVDAAAVRRGLDADPTGFALTARQAAQAQLGGWARGPEGLGDQRMRRLLLVVDQFEQLFTQCSDEAQRRKFIKAIHAAATTRQGPDQAPAALVVLAVRADFDARCANYRELTRAVEDRYVVTSMTGRQLQMAIVEPAKKTGSGVEDELLDVLLREIRTRQSRVPGGELPLLSHALDQAWRSRIGPALSLADYERTGGIEQAVANSAQRSYDHLTPPQKVAAQEIFTRLTVTNSNGADTVKRAALSELSEGKTAAEVRDVDAVLDAFVAERLFTLAAGTVEISHEALLTAWPLLRQQSARLSKAEEQELAGHETKVVLVGEGAVGKTSLVTALLGDPFEEHTRTHGIDIHSLVLDHPESGVAMRLRFWDFGGQTIYRTTHQFFFSPHAVYLVVWNARAGQNKDDVAGWLNHIRLRLGDSAKVMIVATHSDQAEPDLDYASMQRTFGDTLCGHYGVDNRSGAGITDLRAAIVRHAAVQHPDKTFIANWIDARDEILALVVVEPQISYDDFVAVCAGHKMSEDEAETLAKLLHRMGHIVYQDDDETLKDLVILNPEWLSKAIGYVLEDSLTRTNRGILEHDRLADIWRERSGEPRYSRHHYPYFLRLMEKFDISFRLEDGRHSLIAQLVPTEQPELPWYRRTSVAGGMRRMTLICRLTGQVSGLISALIVRLSYADTGLRWRDGVFLRHPNPVYASEALVEIRHETELTIEVRAPSPDLFFHVLRDSVRASCASMARATI